MSAYGKGSWAVSPDACTVLSLRTKCWLRGGVGGKFPRNLNWDKNEQEKGRGPFPSLPNPSLFFFPFTSLPSPPLSTPATQASYLRKEMKLLYSRSITCSNWLIHKWSFCIKAIRAPTLGSLCWRRKKQNLIYNWYTQQLQLNQKYTVEPRYNEPVFWPFVIPRFHFMRARPQFVVPTVRSPLLVLTVAPHVRS